MRRDRTSTARKLAHQMGDYVREHPTALIGGTIAIGFLATHWLMHRRIRIDNPEAFRVSDADDAFDYQLRGSQHPLDDMVGDASVRVSDTLAAERERI